MKTKIAKHAGTCFGVNSAIRIAFEAAARESRLFILGQLVHNPYVVDKLRKKGVKTIDDVSELTQGDNLLIRAHGELKSVYEYCQKNKINIIDCTCPFVKRAQELAAGLESDGYQVVLVGEPDHPEVRGIAAQVKDPVIISSRKDLDKTKISKTKVGVLSQTTQKKDNFTNVVSEILYFPNELKIHNTICPISVILTCFKMPSSMLQGTGSRLQRNCVMRLMLW